MEPNSIKVGSTVAVTKCGPESHGTGIFEKAHLDGHRTWIIAPLPKVKTWKEIPPGSAIQEFNSLEAAENALRRWAAPLPAQPLLRKRASAITMLARKRNAGKPRKEKNHPCQQEFDL
jgi:hypothetical protein